MVDGYIQEYYQIRSGDTEGLNSDTGWAAVENTNATIGTGIHFRIRFKVRRIRVGAADQGATNFGSLRCQSYIFTKVDESEKCGSLINQIMKHRLPISYFTTGQNVPEDIEKANKEKIFNLILNKA